MALTPVAVIRLTTIELVMEAVIASVRGCIVDATIAAVPPYKFKAHSSHRITGLCLYCVRTVATMTVYTAKSRNRIHGSRRGDESPH